MANRYFTQFGLTLAKQTVFLFGRATIGATGAVTLDATNSKGIKTIVRNSAGKYTVTLGNTTSGNDIYPRLFNVSVMQLFATAVNAPIVQVISEAVATTTPTVVLQFYAADGTTATDPSSGQEVRFTVTLTNSTAP